MKGLVLQGGASRGAYIIGAYRALEEAGKQYDAITGTSIGAINGAMIAQGSVQEAWDLWYSLEYKRVIRTDEPTMEYLSFERSWQSIPLWIQEGLKISRNRGLDISPLRELLHAHIDERRLRNAGIRFGLTTINLTRRRIEQPFLEDMPRGTVADYLLASASMAVFRSEPIFGDHYLDGCYYDNLPWSMLTRIGCKDLTLIRIQGGGRVVWPPPEGVRVIQIEPSEVLPDRMGFHHSLTRHTLRLGYLDTKRILGETKGLHYYILADTIDPEEYSLLYDLEEMARHFELNRYHLYEWEDFLFRLYQDPKFHRNPGWEPQKQAIRKRLGRL